MSDMLPQPPPNAPAPPPSAAAIRSRKWLHWIIAVGFLSVIGVIGMTVLSIVTRRHTGCGGAEFVSNARQIGLALFEFDSTYGKFPDDTTIAKLKGEYPASSIPLGTSTSNAYFRQLIVSEAAPSEGMFYARSNGTHKPDNVIAGSNALEKGECGFAYIPGYSSVTAVPGTPLVLYPLVPGKLLFDYARCRDYTFGKAVILRADNSVSSYPVDKTGHVIIDGKDLFDPSQPFWNGKVPDVKWPE